jgi:hypothetical protein
MKAAVSSKRLLSATEPGNQKLVVGVRILHSSMLHGEPLPHPALNEVTKFKDKLNCHIVHTLDGCNVHCKILFTMSFLHQCEPKGGGW